jgi:hypothetical protein
LTRRANQGDINIIADIVKPAPETAAGFLFTPNDWLKKFQSVEAVSLHFLQFVDGSKIVDTSGKSGAKQHHRRNHQARAEKSVAGFFVSIFRSDGGRTSLSQRLSHGRRQRAAVRAFICERY